MNGSRIGRWLEDLFGRPITTPTGEAVAVKHSIEEDRRYENVDVDEDARAAAEKLAVEQPEGGEPYLGTWEFVLRRPRDGYETTVILGFEEAPTLKAAIAHVKAEMPKSFEIVSMAAVVRTTAY